MNLIITEDKISEYEPFEEDGSVLLAEETPWRGFSDELQELYYLKGSQFIHQLKQIVNSGEFRPIDGETDIFSAISEICDDFDNLVNAARKAVEHGYRVYILPNPKGIRTADYFELNPYAREVLLYKGKKQISVTRKSLEDTNFFRTFIRRYAK